MAGRLPATTQRRSRGRAVVFKARSLAGRLAEWRRGAQLTLRPDAQPVERVAEDDPEDVEAVHRAGDHARAGGVREVADRYADLRDPHPGRDELRHDLLVEHEVVGVGEEADALETRAIVRPVAGVELGETQPERTVLDPGEKAV